MIGYDWDAEKTLLRDKTVAEQRAILAKWVKDVVSDMGCTCQEAEKLFVVPLADVLKPGYETFERPRFERGTCCELLHCHRVV